MRLIYKLFLFGLNESAICKYLESNNTPTPSSLSKWHKSTVKSILTNEKYKGDALLQKKFTVDYLNKTVRKNEGKLPQYYIEKGHEPIVSDTVFDLVQQEFGRRKAFQKYYYTNAFSSKIICSCCKGAYVHLTAHSDRASKTVFWRCSNFYDGSTHSPNINDDCLQQGVQLAIMSLLLKYNRVISDCASMLHKALQQYSARKYNDLMFSLLTKSAIERTYDLSEFRLILDYIEVNENKKIRFCFIDGTVVEC